MTPTSNPDLFSQNCFVCIFKKIYIYIFKIYTIILVVFVIYTSGILLYALFCNLIFPHNVLNIF